MQTPFDCHKFSRKFINENEDENEDENEGGLRWVSHYTLLTPLTPSKGGCKPSVYRGFRTLTPLNIKITRARAREQNVTD